MADGSTSRHGSSTPATSRDTTEGTVYTVTGGDFGDVVSDIDEGSEDRIVLNFGPQHPSSHGVLRLVLELEGETIVSARPVIGYLHTGIEKNVEFRPWTQGVSFVTRMDYLSPFFNETAYCMSIERLLGIETPDRARLIRIIMMELNRISSHLVSIAAGGMELGALTAMTMGFREREEILHVFELITGLRMNHSYVRPGGVAQDMQPEAETAVNKLVQYLDGKLPEYDRLLTGQPIWKARMQGVGYLPLDGCLSLGITGPVLRSAGLPWDIRKTEPYLGYEEFEFDVPTATEADSFARYLLRLEEMRESLRIVRQALDRLEPGPVMVEDRKVAWPAQLTIGSDGTGNSLDHVKKIMAQSMESLIHHFKLVTEGFQVPAGQVYTAIESPRGELGYHVVSDGGTRPLRVHVRDPGFVNLQALPAMTEGGMLADLIPALAGIDPVMGGVDR